MSLLWQVEPSYPTNVGSNSPSLLLPQTVLTPPAPLFPTLLSFLAPQHHVTLTSVEYDVLCCSASIDTSSSANLVSLSSSLHIKYVYSIGFLMDYRLRGFVSNDQDFIALIVISPYPLMSPYYHWRWSTFSSLRP